jgi:hypothetical protein
LPAAWGLLWVKWRVYDEAYQQGRCAMNEDFLERMVTLANNVGKELGALRDDTARYDMVEQIMDSAEIVFAVWTDKSAEDGVGYMLVKGSQIAWQAVADKTSVTARVTAIPCISPDQAEALQYDLGERDMRH